jgi:hypothetical protein
MSNDAPRLTKKEKKAPAKERAAAAAEAEAQGGLLGYVVGGMLGLAILFLVWRGTTGDSKSFERPELPHLAIMAEFDDLGIPAVRADLARLQRDLVGLEEEVLGPLNAPLVVRGPGGKPVAKDINELSEQEFAIARQTLSAGGWLVPRIYRGDQKAAIFRVGPAGSPRFPAGTRDKVQKILDSYAGSTLRLSAYSHDLRLNEKGAREQINASFGVQTANCIAYVSGDKSFRGEDGAENVMALYKKTRAIADGNRIRSITTLGSFWVYALSAAKGSAVRDDVQVSSENAKVLEELAKQANITPLVDGEGLRAWVMVTTDAEGKDNIDTCYFVAGNVRGGGMVLRVPR